MRCYSDMPGRRCLEVYSIDLCLDSPTLKNLNETCATSLLFATAPAYKLPPRQCQQASTESHSYYLQLRIRSEIHLQLGFVKRAARIESYTHDLDKPFLQRWGLSRINLSRAVSRIIKLISSLEHLKISKATPTAVDTIEFIKAAIKVCS